MGETEPLKLSKKGKIKMQDRLIIDLADFAKKKKLSKLVRGDRW